MIGVVWCFTADVTEYDAQVGGLLSADPVVHTLPLTVLAGVRTGVHPQRLLGWWHDNGAWGAITHTPPHELVVTALPEQSVEPLVHALHERAWPLSGVVGPTPSAALFAAIWTRHTGNRPVLTHYQRLYLLDQLRLPAQPDGSPRLAMPADRPTVLGWLQAFGDDTGMPTPPDLGQRTDLSISECRAQVWTSAAGRLVSLAGYSRAVAGMVRVGPVYTPPEQRRQGYAAAVTAAAVQHATHHGARHVVLFTDLANPTSNRVGLPAPRLPPGRRRAAVRVRSAEPADTLRLHEPTVATKIE